MKTAPKVHVRWVCPACGYKHAWQWDSHDGRDMDMHCNKCDAVTNMGLRKQPDGSWEARTDWPRRNVKLDIRGMRKLAGYLGNYPAFSSFCWTVWTTQQVKESGIRDPACAMVRGQWGPFGIDIDSDGETDVWFDGEQMNADHRYLPHNLDMGLTPFAICFDLKTQIQSMRS